MQTEAMSLQKLLYGIPGVEIERYTLPKRRHEDIKRSRIPVKRDKHFSTTNNYELIAFAKATGTRRTVLEKLKGDDLWDRNRMISAVDSLQCKSDISEREQVLLSNLELALRTFPDQDYFLHHRQDKNGKSRFAPIIGTDKMRVVERMNKTGSNEKVFRKVHSGADIHSYRADYCNQLYRMYARNISDIPYDKKNRGSGKMYQSEVYVSRKDVRDRFDRSALTICSRALGHERQSVVVSNYLRNL